MCVPGGQRCLFTAVFLGPGTVPGTQKVLSTHLLVVAVLRLFPGVEEYNHRFCVLFHKTLFSLGSQAAEIFPMSSFSVKRLMSLIVFVSIVPLLFSGRLSHTLNILTHFLSWSYPSLSHRPILFAVWIFLFISICFWVKTLALLYIPWILSCGVLPVRPLQLGVLSLPETWLLTQIWSSFSCLPGWVILLGSVVLPGQYLRPGLYLPLSCLVCQQLISPSCAFPESPPSKVSRVHALKAHTVHMFSATIIEPPWNSGNPSSILCSSSQISLLISGHSCVSTWWNCHSLWRVIPQVNSLLTPYLTF